MRIILAGFLGLAMAGCHPAWYSMSPDPALYDIVDTARDPAVESMIVPYRDSLSMKMDEVVAVAATDLVKAQPESALGNLVAHIVFTSAEDYFGTTPDFSVQNYGGLRIPKLSAGDITRGRVFELMPFENYVVLMHLEGGVVKQLLDHMAGKGGWPVHGVRYRIVDGQAEHIEINGQPLQSRQSYAVALPDYLANGGDDCSFLRSQPREESDRLIRDAILSYLLAATQRGENIEAETDGRVSYGD